MFLLVPAYPGCPRQTAVKWLLFHVATGHTSVDIGASAKLELVDKFSYRGDMLSMDGDADAAVEARIRIGWNKFMQLVPLLTNNDVSLIMRGGLYSSCVKQHVSWKWDLACKERKCGGTSASRDENGQVECVVLS